MPAPIHSSPGVPEMLVKGVMATRSTPVGCAEAGWAAIETASTVVNAAAATAGGRSL